MTKRVFIAGLICLLLAGMNVVTAQEATPEPSIENECSPGGVLYREENQDGCPTEWHWKAGWYLAQYNNGELSREDFPDEFAETLPPPIEIPPPSPPVITDDDGILTICHFYSGSMSDYCLKSNFTGTVISTIPDQPTLFFFLIIPRTGTCPPMSDGHGLRVAPRDITGFYFYGFTSEEYAMLGFDETYLLCEYNYLGNW
ncbi:MAG: hypothetical protein LCI00_28780 [Chloroflexi bacterium]|nr:hypothetical protein [Chloroflexota bacterium]MCC6891543.1 hypothetical protein [Anaerolineae bacterium]